MAASGFDSGSERPSNDRVPGDDYRANPLTNDGTKKSVERKFRAMDDFSPANDVSQVDPLKRLLETRDTLRDLLTKIERSTDLENVLEDVLNNTAKLKELSQELGLVAGDSSSTDDGVQE